MAACVLSVLRAVAGASVPRLDGVAIDGRVMAFTLVTAVATAVAFGLLPALRNSERAQADALRSRTRGNAGSRGRTWSFLVATEVALALMLLAGSGLLIRSFQAVLAEDPGFDPGDVALTTIAPSGIKYPALEDAARFWEDLLDRVEGAPGVAASGVISSRPLGGAPNGRLSLDGNPDKVGDGLYVVASAGTFEALDIPLVRGRLFQDSDAPGAPHAVVVSQSFAERYWPGLDPIGRLVSGGGMDDYWNADPVVFGTVVGVVGDVRYRDLTRVGEPVVYWHYKQRPFRIRRGGTLLAEAAEGDPARVAPTLRDVVRAADPDVAVDLRYLEDLVMGSVDERRFLLLVLGGFAGVALVLAGVGIYGVVSYAVAQRTREMGIRLALGAAPASVRSLVLSGALRPVALGLLLGLAGGLASSRVLGSFLYEVPATDWVTFAAVAGLLLATAVLASWVPAQRGTRVDPILAMRAE
jgi:predicted permease